MKKGQNGRENDGSNVMSINGDTKGCKGMMNHEGG